MFFRQINDIVTGRKTQTRRVVKENELPWVNGIGPNGELVEITDVKIMRPRPDGEEEPLRVKWAVGHTYTVCPGRGLPAALWKPDGITNTAWCQDRSGRWHPTSWVSYGSGVSEADINRDVLSRNGYVPLRIRITEIRRERLQDISLDDTAAEGIGRYTFARGCLSDPRPDPRWKYIELWNSINKRPGTRWADDPLVWVLSFVLVKEVS